MSQVFSADSVSTTTATTVTTTNETTIVTGNFLNPPFGNAKGVAIASVVLQPGTGSTTATIRLRRNPNGENLQVGALAGIGVTAGVAVGLTVVGSDPIPDGRPVQYAITVQQAGASANGTTFATSLFSLLISG